MKDVLEAIMLGLTAVGIVVVATVGVGLDFQPCTATQLPDSAKHGGGRTGDGAADRGVYRAHGAGPMRGFRVRRAARAVSLFET